jgi:hypothetical protein
VLIAETLVYKANPPAAQQRLSAAAGRVSSFGGYGMDYKPLVIIEGTAEFTGVTFKLRGTGATLRTAEKGQTVEVHGTIKPTRSTRASSRPRSPAPRSPRSRSDHLHPQASAGPRAGYPARASGTPTRRRQSAGVTQMTKPTVYYS